jgi:dihydrofolate synthase/folylpolyglutamate synthase
MTTNDAHSWWFARVNYETRAPAPSDLSLERMRALMRALGSPERRLRILHVTGTKGKGSTSAMLASILHQSGYRTGLFTSPHLSGIEERFQVDGVPISSPELTQLLTDIRSASEASRLEPTFFEIATAAGFLHFERRACEAAVVEVGLGGRLDSTNVCTPVVSVITSISHDHVRVLGSTLGQIAREKAGIIKPGRPVISGEVKAEPAAVIEEVARSRGAPLRRLGEGFGYGYSPGRLGPGEEFRPEVTVWTRERTWPPCELSLLGRHQAANASVAIACVEALRGLGWHLPDDAVKAGLASARWPARIEVVRRSPWVVLDCAHNVASAAALVTALEESLPPGPRCLLFASSSDKDVAGMFEVLKPHFCRALFTRFTNSPRAMDPQRLADHWGGGEVHPFPEDALQVGLAHSGPLCITGSVFLAGQLRPFLVDPG